MEGIIDPINRRANVWANGTHYHLQTDQGTEASAAPIVQQVIAALQTENWAALYSVLAGDIRSQYSQAQFVQLMTSEATAAQQPAITSVTPTGSGNVIASPLGYTYYQQPLTVQVRQSDGSNSTFTTTLYLLWEQGTWRY